MSLIENIDANPGSDKFLDMYLKLNTLIDAFNSAMGGGATGQSIRKVNGTDFNFEFFTPFSSLIKFKEVNLGAWNIGVDLERSVGHGLDFSKIKGVQVTIFNDAETNARSVDYPEIVGPAYNPSGKFTVTNSNVDVTIRSGSVFTDSQYTGTGSNRGIVLIAYVD